MRIDMLARYGLCFSLLSALSSCSTSRSAAQQPASDGGLSLILPPNTCPDVGALRLADAGACVSSKPRSFTGEIVPLFNSCAGEICHSFNAGAIAQQVGIPSVECCGELQMIEPGHPERSYVLRKLIGQGLCAGSQMPLEAPAFNSDDLQTVADWICQGAGTTP
ncbi:MAG TPA: hypothetical protein VGF76_16090 [Polyangiaceae bacterium]